MALCFRGNVADDRKLSVNSAQSISQGFTYQQPEQVVVNMPTPSLPAGTVLAVFAKLFADTSLSNGQPSGSQVFIPGAIAVAVDTVIVGALPSQAAIISGSIGTVGVSQGMANRGVLVGNQRWWQV